MRRLRWRLACWRAKRHRWPYPTVTFPGQWAPDDPHEPYSY